MFACAGVMPEAYVMGKIMRPSCGLINSLSAAGPPVFGCKSDKNSKFIRNWLLLAQSLVFLS